MAKTDKISPQGYALGGDPKNVNPFWNGEDTPAGTYVTSAADFVEESSAATVHSLSINKSDGTSENFATIEVPRVDIPDGNEEDDILVWDAISGTWLPDHILKDLEGRVDTFDRYELILADGSQEWTATQYTKTITVSDGSQSVDVTIPPVTSFKNGAVMFFPFYWKGATHYIKLTGKGDGVPYEVTGILVPISEKTDPFNIATSLAVLPWVESDLIEVTTRRNADFCKLEFLQDQTFTFVVTGTSENGVIEFKTNDTTAGSSLNYSKTMSKSFIYPTYIDAGAVFLLFRDSPTAPTNIASFTGVLSDTSDKDHTGQTSRLPGQSSRLVIHGGSLNLYKDINAVTSENGAIYFRKSVTWIPSYQSLGVESSPKIRITYYRIKTPEASAALSLEV